MSLDKLPSKKCILPLMADPEYDIEEWLKENEDSILLVNTNLNQVICTSIEEIVASIMDRDRSKYLCPAESMRDIDRDTYYVQFSYGMDLGENGYISVDEFERVISLFKTKKERIFKVKFVTVEPFSVSVALAQNDNPEDHQRFVSANHCQKGSNLRIYKIDGIGNIDTIAKTQRNYLLSIQNYTELLTACGNSNQRKKLCENDILIGKHIDFLRERKDWKKKLLFYSKKNRNSYDLNVFNYRTGETKNIIARENSVCCNYELNLMAAVNSRNILKVYYTFDFRNVLLEVKNVVEVLSISDKYKLISCLQKESNNYVYAVYSTKDMTLVNSTNFDDINSRKYKILNTIGDCDLIAFEDTFVTIGLNKFRYENVYEKMELGGKIIMGSTGLYDESVIVTAVIIEKRGKKYLNIFGISQDISRYIDDTPLNISLNMEVYTLAIAFSDKIQICEIDYNGLNSIRYIQLNISNRI